MFEKLTKLFREGQRQEGTRTLVEWAGDGSWGGGKRHMWAAAEEATSVGGPPAGVGGQV